MTKLELELIERIGRAKAHLKGAHQTHLEQCRLNLNSDVFGCNCGVEKHNAKLDDAMEALDITDLAD